MIPDKIDRQILAALQRNGKLTNVELAEEIGLSPSPCLRRVKLLEQAGFIDRYVALLSPKRLGYQMTVFVRVWLVGQDDDTVNRFIEAVRQLDEVMECYLMAGDCDFILRVIAHDLEGYRRFQSQNLARIEGVRSLKTEIPMEKVKVTWELPIKD